MFGDPERIFGREPVPTVGAGRLRQDGQAIWRWRERHQRKDCLKSDMESESRVSLATLRQDATETLGYPVFAGMVAEIRQDADGIEL